MRLVPEGSPAARQLQHGDEEGPKIHEGEARYTRWVMAIAFARRAKGI